MVNLNFLDVDRGLTHAVDKVILVPPDAPTTILTLPSESVKIDGHVDDNGRRPESGALNNGVGYLSPYDVFIK